MVELTFRHTTKADIHYVAEYMRQEDVAEVKAATGHSPLDALLYGENRSDETVTAVSPDDIPLVIFGIAPKALLSDVGVPWLLGCDEALRYKRNFMTDTPKVLEIMLKRYKLLENYVHVKNRVSVRWLKALGFIMDEPILYPHTGEYFMRFHMKRC